MTPAISVVIPVLDMATTIGPCLDALMAQSLPADQFEVIVVDNGSTDGTPDVVRRYPVTLLHEPAPGACHARNRGIAAAQGTFIAFTDADCVPSRGWLSAYTRAVVNNDLDIVAGPLAVLDPDASVLSQYSASLGQYAPERTLAHPTFPYAATGNLCVRRSMFDVVGPFNPAFPTYDSAEFFWRLKQRGPIRARVERRALVFYRTRASISAFVRQNYGYGLGAGRLLRQADDAGRLAHGGAALRAWRTRVSDAGTVARASARGAWTRTAALVGLHVIRETAIATGFLAATLRDL